MHNGNGLPRVLVAHPSRQHSHRLAMGLADNGMLVRYLAGIPARPNAMPFWIRPFMRQFLQARAIPIDESRVRHNYTAVAIRKLSSRFGVPTIAAKGGCLGDDLFDRWASRQIAPLRPDIIVCYELAALHSFRVAKQLGMITILDAASFHHAWQDRFYSPRESASAHAQMVARKDAEIALADHILTVSEFARQSYVDAGVAPERVHAIPMGVEVRQFAAEERETSSDARRPVRFVFVGQVGRRKGADVLHDAASRFGSRTAAFRLSLIGNNNSDIQFDEMPFAQHLGWMPQERLACEFKNHDVLILPSRHDSFGMVVAEAMASGLPVIVSDHVGAKEMVDEGKNGLVVPAGDALELAQAMQWFIDHRAELPAMSRAARKMAECYDWAYYRQRAVDFFGALLAPR